MKKCPNCNKIYDDTWAVCLYDKTHLKLISPEPLTPTEKANIERTKALQEKYRKQERKKESIWDNKVVVILLAILVGIALLGLVFLPFIVSLVDRGYDTHEEVPDPTGRGWH